MSSGLQAGVVVFPGSNCDHDTYHVLDKVAGAETRFVWHTERDLSDLDLVVLPGGFSYGDYLRAGAIARISPVVESVQQFAEDGGLVLGICNGFQVLTEAGLLPGALITNDNLEFRCEWTHVRVESLNTPFTGELRDGEVLRIPVAHKEGNYFAPDPVLDRLEENGQVIFRYCDTDGESDTGDESARYNPNGSKRHIAGISNEEGNVVGMMPHPERASEKLLGSEDGRRLFLSVMESAGTPVAAK